MNSVDENDKTAGQSIEELVLILLPEAVVEDIKEGGSGRYDKTIQTLDTIKDWFENRKQEFGPNQVRSILSSTPETGDLIIAIYLAWVEHNNEQ